MSEQKSELLAMLIVLGVAIIGLATFSIVTHAILVKTGYL